MIGYCISVTTISTYKDTIQLHYSDVAKWIPLLNISILSNYFEFYLIPLQAFTRCSGVTSLEFLGLEEKLLTLPRRCKDDVLMECPLLRRFRSWSYWCCWCDEDDDVVMYGWEIEEEQVPPWLTSLVFKRMMILVHFTTCHQEIDLLNQTAHSIMFRYLKLWNDSLLLAMPTSSVSQDSSLFRRAVVLPFDIRSSAPTQRPIFERQKKKQPRNQTLIWNHYLVRLALFMISTDLIDVM